MSIRYKKRIRLKDFNYIGSHRYFITLCTHDKKILFRDNPSLVEWLIEVLREKSKAFGFNVWAYCFMPDHLHLLLEGKETSSDMRGFISSFKQATSFLYKKQTGLRLWQINFYDHVLRKEEDTVSVVHYIFSNPMRKGLVENFEKYPFLGSFELDVTEM